MFIKICGITSIETAKVVESAGADFIGFVFAPSKRRISPEKAKRISRELSPRVKKVGVFVNESVENIISIADEVGIDYIQLHGDEDELFAKQIPFPIIKAFSIEQTDVTTIERYPAEFILLDSPGKKYRGGTGETFNWERINELELDKQKIMLAGGLNVHNVQRAIQLVAPRGIDVSSGVETNGIKDHVKIKQFIKRAREVELI